MKPNKLKKIDNTLGHILLVILRPLIYLIDSICQRRRPLASPQKISFLKILGGGSLLIAYPAILGIRKRYPDARLVLICAAEVRIYAELTDLFDEIAVVRTDSIFQIINSSLSALYACFASDIFINYELHSKLSAIFTSISLSKERYGLYQDWNRWQDRYINHPIFYNSATPIYIGYEQISQKIDAQPASWDEACNHFQRYLQFSRNQEKNCLSDILAIAPFCSALYKERQFSMNDFVSILSRHISPEINGVVVLGGEGDRLKANELTNLISDQGLGVLTKNLAGETTLRDVVKLLQGISVLISIDSGLHHIARLLQVSTITYWGPSDPNLRLKSVDDRIEKVFFRKISCAPCVHLIDIPPCAGNNICMKQFLDPELSQGTNDGWEIS